MKNYAGCQACAAELSGQVFARNLGCLLIEIVPLVKNYETNPIAVWLTPRCSRAARGPRKGRGGVIPEDDFKGPGIRLKKERPAVKGPAQTQVI